MGIKKSRAPRSFSEVGFTLIEAIVVVGVISVTLPVIFSILFVILQMQTKIFRLSTVKKEGDYILNLVENNIKDNAISIHADKTPPPDSTNKVCDLETTTYGQSPTVTKLYFLNKAGSWFGYYLDGTTLVSDSLLLGSGNLNSPKTQIINFSISCAKNNFYSPSTVSLSYDIQFCATSLCDQTRPEEIALLHYQTRIKLRN